MDQALLSRFPHLSWLAANYLFQPDTGPWCVNWQSNCHSVCLTLNRPYSVHWIHQGSEVAWTAHRGTVHFMPCDGRQHVLLTRAQAPCDFFLAFIPRRHISQLAHSEGMASTKDLQRLLIPADAVLQKTMFRLSSYVGSPAEDAGCADEAARLLILRLLELNGGGKPEWHDDASLFDRQTLLNLVAYVDAHLQIAPSLSEIATLTGLSPSHFAKKFRRSMGLSLNRFVNRRRILRSLETLKTDTSLASVALDLGFSSQSHFTRIFSSLTGMTPARYQKQVRPVIG